MDKRRSILNVTVSIISRILLLFAAFFVRRLLIQYIGNDVNGLNSLYTSIIGLLSVAELGIGSAIIYSMYKPITEGDQRQVAALYCLYGKLYRMIGAVIFLAGLIVLPFLPCFISDYESIHVNVYLTFFLILVSVVLSYLYGAKTSLITAYKDNYITTGILTVGQIMRYVLQSLSILVFRSFVLFLSCQIIETIVIWFLTDAAVRKRHCDIVKRREVIDQETRGEIVRNVKAMFMHRIGTVLVNTIDSTIISAFIGVAILGKYSNYTLIAGTLSGMIALFFSPLTSVIGHLCASGEKEQIKRYFNFFYCMNYTLGVVFFHGYYAVIDPVIRLCFGLGLEVSREVSFIIALNVFLQYMRNATLLFRNASGTFYYDRWKPIIEGIVNLFLSLILVNVLPENLKIVGVIVATIITTLLICDIVDPYVVFKHVFEESTKKFWIRNYLYIGLFTSSLYALNYVLQPVDGEIMGILMNGMISVAISFLLLCLIAMIDRAFRMELWTVGRKTIAWIHRKKNKMNFST